MPPFPSDPAYIAATIGLLKWVAAYVAALWLAWRLEDWLRARGRQPGRRSW